MFANGECPSAPPPAHPSHHRVGFVPIGHQEAVLGLQAGGEPPLRWHLLGEWVHTAVCTGRDKLQSPICAHCSAVPQIISRPPAALPDDLRSPIRIEREELRNLHFFPPEYGREWGSVWRGGEGAVVQCLAAAGLQFGAFRTKALSQKIL